MFYSKSTGGFYDSAIHGALKIIIADPAWVRPTKTVILQPGESYRICDQVMQNDNDTPGTWEDVPDMDIVAPTVEVDNADCKIPADAVEITAEEHAALLDGQSSGKFIVAGFDGRPELTDPPAPTAKQIETTLATAVQAHMDAIAQTRGYDNMLSAVSYADEPAVPAFQVDGLAFRAWRSTVWAKCHQVLAEVQTGARPVPSADELIGLLPEVGL